MDRPHPHDIEFVPFRTSDGSIWLTVTPNVPGAFCHLCGMIEYTIFCRGGYAEEDTVCELCLTDSLPERDRQALPLYLIRLELWRLREKVGSLSEKKIVGNRQPVGVFVGGWEC